MLGTVERAVEVEGKVGAGAEAATCQPPRPPVRAAAGEKGGMVSWM